MTGVDFKRDQIQIFATTGAVTRGEVMITPINMLGIADVFLDSVAKTEFRAIGTLALRRRAPYQQSAIPYNSDRPTLQMRLIQ